MPTTTVSISEAKQRLGEIADRADQRRARCDLKEIEIARTQAAGNA